MLLRLLLISLFLLSCDSSITGGTGACESSFAALDYDLKNAFLDIKQCEKVDIGMLESMCNCDTSRYYGGVKLSKRTFCKNTVYLEESYPYGGVSIRYKNGLISYVTGTTVSTFLKECYKEKLTEDLSICNSYTTMVCSQ
jgi:hypothetical protein